MLASRISHARRLSVLLPRIVRTASTTQRPSYKFEPSTGNRRKDPMAEIHHPPTPDRDDSHISKKARLEDEGGAETAHVVPSDEAMHDAESSTAQQPKAKPAKNRNKKHKKHKIPAIEPYSNEDVIYHDVKALLGEDAVLKAQEEGSDLKAPFERWQELELVVSALSSNGAYYHLLRFSYDMNAWHFISARRN